MTSRDAQRLADAILRADNALCRIERLAGLILEAIELNDSTYPAIGVATMLESVRELGVCLEAFHWVRPVRN